MLADNNANTELLLSFCLIIIDNSFSNDNNDNVLTFDVGSIGPQAKKFDPDWQPR